MGNDISDGDAPKQRLTLWQWIRQNDIVILIAVGLITITCTRIATHVDEHYVQPNINKVLRVPEGQQPTGIKAFLQFALIVLLIYLVVEFILKPDAPIASYLLPDAVSRVKEGTGTAPGPNTSNPQKTHSSAWEESFQPPVKPTRTVNQWPYN